MPSNTETKIYLGDVLICGGTAQQLNSVYESYTNFVDVGVQSEITYEQLQVYSSGII